MHIQDFHLKLTSVKEEGHIFEALRNLSQIDDPRVFDSESVLTDWPTWPALDVHAASAGA